MKRFMGVIVAAIAAVGIVACEDGGGRQGEKTGTVTVNERIATAATPSDTAQLPSPSGTMPLPSSSGAPQPSPSADEDAFAAAVDRTFAQALRLPDDGYVYENLQPLNDSEALLVGRSKNPDHDASKLVYANLATGELRELRTVDGRLQNFEWLPGTGTDASSLKAQWSEYGEAGGDGTGSVHTVRLTGSKVQRYPGLAADSPDGSKIAAYGGGQAGILVLDAATGESVRRTTGSYDVQPLWLPDGSGFLYLKDTGNQLGDGAGPAYALAKFDLRTGKSRELPLERGFWGRIGWLTPGSTILAENGFDDGIGLMTVDLQSGTAIQILSTTDIDYAKHAVNSSTQQLVVSELGKMTFYSEKGQKLGAVPWPSGLDEALNVNPDWSENQEDTSVPYYAAAAAGGRVGPFDFRFSPDGSKLLYQLGAIGSSVDDAVHGARLILASADGTAPAAVTNEWLLLPEVRWLPSSDAVMAIAAASDEAAGAYIGLLRIKP